MNLLLKTYFSSIIILTVSFTARAQPGEEVYATYCAGCHGHELKGGSASPLIKTDWKHGGDRKSILNSIENGVPGTEMARWSTTLSDEEIKAVTDYIVAAQKRPIKKNKTPKPTVVTTKKYQLKIDKVISEGLDAPWAFEFVDKNRVIISEKKGQLRWMVNGKLNNQPITGTPKTYAQENYGGYMDVALDPDFVKNGWIYLAFSHNTTNTADKEAPGMTKIVRGKVKENKWMDEQVLFEVNDSLNVTGGMRWGCRFLFDKQGYLYFTIGDMNRGEDAQILSRPSGKVFRINSDGSIPKDNPLVGKENLLQAIYTWGNRNVQGMAINPVNGLLYASEHGPKGGDELNILKHGANYGWPVITYGIGYDGAIISKDTAKEGMEQPITYWTPSIAINAIEFVNASEFPLWKNNLIVTALAFEEIRRLVIDNNKVTEQEILLKGYGRVRDLKFGPDGAMYVLTNAPDALVRIVPLLK